MARDLLPPAPTTEQPQIVGGVGPHTALAQAMMGSPQQMAGGGGQVPLGSLMTMLQNPAIRDALANSGVGQGISNWTQGYQWDGMAGNGMTGSGGILDGLTAQAAGNVAGGAPGL